jgi:hypothetical protein
VASAQRLGREAVPALVEALEGKETDNFPSYAAALGAIGAAARKEDMTALVRVLGTALVNTKPNQSGLAPAAVEAVKQIGLE